MGSQRRDPACDGAITRRDFIDGVLAMTGAVAATTFGSMQPAFAAMTAPDGAVNYPPLRQGLRGFDQGAVDAGHAVRDGNKFAAATDTRETYDLIVVGAGMSGLAAAAFYRQQIPNAKVLILDGCEDFGGHAMRNEFDVDGRLLIARAGTHRLWLPNTFPPECRQLLKDIGVDSERYYQAIDAHPDPVKALGLKEGMFFARETYGVDRLLADSPMASPSGATRPPVFAERQKFVDFFAKAPFSPAAKEGLLELYTGKKDYMPGVSTDEKVRQLRKMSYMDYLAKVVRLHPDALAYVTAVGGSGGNQGAGPDTYSAWYAWRRGAAGFGGMGLPNASQNSNLTKQPGRHIQFPDGAAGAARLLVRHLIPDALPGTSMEDSITRRVSYEKLDRSSNDVRIRLRSTVVNVRHQGEARTAKEVLVSYVRDGKVFLARSQAVVMACFNNIVPHLVPELPDAQKEALSMAKRKPLAIVNVAVRNWRSFAKLGVYSVNCPGMFFSSFNLAPNVSFGGYRNPSDPSEPNVITMSLSNSILEAPGSGLPPKQQWMIARAKLLAIPFEAFEANIRTQLDRVLGAGGFSSERDIAGITVNRWGHGYAAGTNELYDPDYSHRDDAPWIVGRKRFGRIAIANSDAAAVSLAQAAWQQSHRAVNELITDIVRPVFDFNFAERDSAGEPGDYPSNF
jgi:spermidine dehydrogenase